MVDKNIEYAIEALTQLINEFNNKEFESFRDLRKVVNLRLYDDGKLKRSILENEFLNNNDIRFFTGMFQGLFTDTWFPGGSREHANKYIEYFQKAKNILEKISAPQTTQKDNQLQVKKLESKEINTISTINIKKLYAIDDITLENLSDQREIYIVGENGDGKTLLLQGIALGLKGVEEGEVFDFLKGCDPEISVVDGDQNRYDFNQTFRAKNFFAYGVSRNQHSEKKDQPGYLTLFDAALDLNNPVEWLQQIDYANKSNQSGVIPLKTATDMLENLLDHNVKIKVDFKKVQFIERGSDVSFKQLSAGYQGVLNIVTDLLSRLAETQPEIIDTKKYRGVVLIDEVELHLHPKWQYNFVSKLRNYFPLIQFIITTHSPTVLLGASRKAIFYKVYKENGVVQVSNRINHGDFTINSITSSPIFDLEEITSRDYNGDFSSDDFITEKIHRVIRERIKKMPLSIIFPRGSMLIKGIIIRQKKFRRS